MNKNKIKKRNCENYGNGKIEKGSKMWIANRNIYMTFEDTYSSPIRTRKVGRFEEKVIKALGLSVKSGTPILLSKSNVSHMKKQHLLDYNNYGEKITEILKNPDYIGENLKNNSIGYYKKFKIGKKIKYVKVAVRISGKGNWFVRTLYVVNKNKILNLIKRDC